MNRDTPSALSAAKPLAEVDSRTPGQDIPVGPRNFPSEVRPIRFRPIGFQGFALSVLCLVAVLLVLSAFMPVPTLAISSALVAAGAAYLAGSLGVGFGALLVPALLILGVDPRVAVASSLISQLVVVPLGGASHARLGHVRSRVVIPLVATGALGAFTGAHFSLSLDEGLLRGLIAGSTIAMGILVLGRGIPNVEANGGDAAKIRWEIIAGIGFVAGFAASAFGTGWGPVGVSLLLLAGVVPRLAVGSSVAARAPIALFAVLAYVSLAGSQRIVELSVLLPILAGGAFGMVSGVLATRRLAGRTLSRVLGTAVAALGLLVLARP